MTKSQLESRIAHLEECLSDAADALDHAVLWIEDYAIPHLDPEGTGDVDGGNSLAAGLTMKAEEIREMIGVTETERLDA